MVSGLQPELTNAFLVALAECASDSSLDNAEAVRRCLAGEKPGFGPIPLKTKWVDKNRADMVEVHEVLVNDAMVSRRPLDAVESIGPLVQ